MTATATSITTTRIRSFDGTDHESRDEEGGSQSDSRGRRYRRPEAAIDAAGIPRRPEQVSG